MFVHGFPEFWYEWKNQLVEFGQDYLAVAPDMRGYNLSSKPAEVELYRTKYLVEDLRQLAEHLGHKCFALVGHDWGGAVAWAFALRYPDYLERLIIINAPHPGVFARELRENPAQQQASQYILTFQGSQAEENLAADNYASLVDTVLSDGLKKGYFTEEDRRMYLEAWAQPGTITAALNYYRATAFRPPAAGRSQKAESPVTNPSSLIVRVPTLVIWGEQDQALRLGNLEGLDEFVTDLTVKRVPDGSHWVIHEKPALVNSYIRGFIEGR